MRKMLLASAALLALLSTSRAGNIDLFTTNAQTDTLTLVAVPPPGNQPLNTPCIICGTNQPQQDATFGYNNYQQGGNITSFSAFSTSQLGGVQLANDQVGLGYDRAFLLAFLAAQNAVSMNIGIDVNTANGQGAENLLYFGVLNLTQHTVLSQFIGAVPLPTANNGTGFPDYVLTGFDINRGDIAPGDQIIFYANWNNTSDGAESFFLVPTPVAVPGPLVGAGLPGLIAACFSLLMLAYRRRKVVVA